MNYFTYRPKASKLFNPQENGSLKNKAKKYQTKSVNVQNQNVERMLDVYRWRAETQFPIVKVISAFIICQQQKIKQANSNFKTIQVSYQQQAFTFADLSQMPLFKVLYLLKQTLIGLQRLFNKFGPFLFTEEMIFIDEESKCKVWINQLVHLNSTVSTKQKESQFLNHIFTLFKDKTTETKQAIAFFGKIKNTNSFFSALQCIQSFVFNQKLKIPTNFKIYSQINGSISLEKKKKKVNLNLTMSKRPKFLNSILNSAELNEEKREQEKQKQIVKHTVSSKFIPRIFPLKVQKIQMKISGDTAPESVKDIQKNKVDKYESFQVVKSKNEKDGLLWLSGREQRAQKLKCSRKFSNVQSPCLNRQQKTNPLQKQLKKKQEDFMNSIAQSMVFCDEAQNNNFSRSSSAKNIQKLVEKKKEVFNVNGWNLKVDSLFSGKDEFKKSFLNKDATISSVRQYVKLDLLDKCPGNLCESFINDQKH